MVKFLFLALCLIATFGQSSTSTDIKCNFNNGVTYPILSNIYRCEVNNNPNILTEESAQINKINGTHESEKTNNDVLGFHVESKIIQIFPKGLENFFQNIKLLFLYLCQLKEIHQSDLKVFPNLVLFYSSINGIEVIEEGLFDFNPNLELVGFSGETKIIHIDPNVFDNLNKLHYFRFIGVPCINQDVKDSKEKVQEAIKVVKSKCSNSDFLLLLNQLKTLETESLTLDPKAFVLKFENFEQSIKNSKFLKFRPLFDKFQNMKLTVANSKNILQNELRISLRSLTSSVNDYGSKLDKIIKSQSELNENMCVNQNNVTRTFNEALSLHKTLKESIDHIWVKIDAFKSSQIISANNLGSRISKLDSKLRNHEAMLQSSHMETCSSINELRGFQNDTVASIRYIKLTQDTLITSQDISFANLTSKFNELQKYTKSSQDETKLSLSDIVATLSDHTKFQTDAKDSFIKIRTVQNEIRKSLNDLSINRHDNSDDKFSLLNDKVESLEGHFENLESKIGGINADLTKKLHKMSTNFDEKFKGIENRLIKKIEEILEKKLGKFLAV